MTRHTAERDVATNESKAGHSDAWNASRVAYRQDGQMASNATLKHEARRSNIPGFSRCTAAF